MGSATDDGELSRENSSTAASVPSDVLPRMRAAWSRIEDWLVQYAPETYEDLRPGVSEEALDAVEAEVGFAMDPSLRALYRIHDGDTMAGVPFEHFDWLTLDCAVAQWRSWRDDNDHEPDSVARFAEEVRCDPPGCVSLAWCEPGWFPIGRDGFGNDLVVDHAPGPSGVRGQLTRRGAADWSEPRGIEGTSVLAMIEKVADQLEAGAFVVEDGLIERDDDFTLDRVAATLDRRGVHAASPERVGLRRLARLFAEENPRDLENDLGGHERWALLLLLAAFEAFMDEPSDDGFARIAEILRGLGAEE